VKLKTHHHEIPMVRISVPPLPLYVFVGWTGKTCVCMCVYNIYIPVLCHIGSPVVNSHLSRNYLLCQPALKH